MFKRIKVWLEEKRRGKFLERTKGLPTHDVYTIGDRFPIALLSSNHYHIKKSGDVWVVYRRLLVPDVHYIRLKGLGRTSRKIIEAYGDSKIRGYIKVNIDVVRAVVE